MGIDRKEFGSLVVLHPQTKYLDVKNGEDLYSQVRKAAETGSSRVLIDLSGVKLANSGGIGSLIGAYSAVTSNGGKMVLSGVDKELMHVLQAANLAKAFDLYDSEEEAIQALEEKP